jgi:hypothetical protein
MELSYADAVTYMTAPKQLIAPADRPFGPDDWAVKKNNAGRQAAAFFEARVGLRQAMPRGLKFRISIFPAHPETATFQLELDLPNTKTCLPLYRLEWGALSGHGNLMDQQFPEELRGLVFEPGETHAHSCLDHLTPERLAVRKGGVHAARKIESPILSYEGALRYACGTLNIENPEVVPPPGVQWTLFNTP